MIKKYHFLQHTIMLQAAFALAITLPMHDTFAVEANPEPQDKPFKANYYKKTKNHLKAEEKIKDVRKSMSAYYADEERIRNSEHEKLKDLRDALVAAQVLPENQRYGKIELNIRDIASDEILDTWLEENNEANIAKRILEKKEPIKEEPNEGQIEIIEKFIYAHNKEVDTEKKRHENTIIEMKNLQTAREDLGIDMPFYFKKYQNKYSAEFFLERINPINQKLYEVDAKIKTIEVPITEGNVMQAVKTIKNSIAEISELSINMSNILKLK